MSLLPLFIPFTIIHRWYFVFLQHCYGRQRNNRSGSRFFSQLPVGTIWCQVRHSIMNAYQIIILIYLLFCYHLLLRLSCRCTDMNVDYSSQGFEHLSDVINKINNRSNNRRVVLSAWSPSDLQPLLLPSCDIFAQVVYPLHLFFCFLAFNFFTENIIWFLQFYLSNGELFCQMFQSSANVALDVPRNVASFALLTRIISHVCGKKKYIFFPVVPIFYLKKKHIQLDVWLNRILQIFVLVS